MRETSSSMLLLLLLLLLISLCRAIDVAGLPNLRPGMKTGCMIEQMVSGNEGHCSPNGKQMGKKGKKGKKCDDSEMRILYHVFG
jgi:hypothetical protein